MGRGITLRTEIAGITDLSKLLKGMEQKLQKQLVGKGMSKVGQDMIKHAKMIAPKRTGQLKKSLGYKVKRYKNCVTVIVGARMGSKF